MVISEFNGMPEVFVPADRKQELDDALKIVYNVTLVPGHATPWYRIQGPQGPVDDLIQVTDILNEVVAAYGL